MENRRVKWPNLKFVKKSIKSDFHQNEWAEFWSSKWMVESVFG